MKNKFLAIFTAAGIATLGSALLSTPAHAQLGPVDQDVTVNFDIPEVLYLRTFQTVNLAITEADLAGGTAVTASGLQIAPDYDTTPSDGTGTIDTTSPFAVAAIPKRINELYAVWSNNPNGIAVTVTSTATTPRITGINKLVADPVALIGLETPHVSGIDFDVDIRNLPAGIGALTETINVSVESL